MKNLNSPLCHCEETAVAESVGVTKQTPRRHGDEFALAAFAHAHAWPRNDIWIGYVIAIFFLCSFQDSTGLRGTWEYLGGLYNGKKDNPPTEYTLQRTYDDAHFNAYALEKGYKPEKYEAGDYIIKGDTCIETQTFTIQPTKLKNTPIHYLFSVRNDSLILRGTLPTGMVVEEYWKRVK